MTNQELTIRLREALVECYGTLDDARRVARDAGLNVFRINLTSNLVNVWDNILAEAVLQGRLRALVDVAVTEYPRFGTLTSAASEVAEYHFQDTETSQPHQHGHQTPTTSQAIPIPSIAVNDQVVRPQDWLNLHGFSKNPFEDTEADREGELLFKYFFDNPVFDMVMGIDGMPQSTVIAASHGCGKSALRRMIANACRPQKPRSSVLAVEYMSFESFSESAERSSPAEILQQHLKVIFEKTIETFIHALLGDDILASTMPVYRLSLLKSYWQKYGSTFNRPDLHFERVTIDIPNTMADGATHVIYSDFARAWETQNLSSYLMPTTLWQYSGVQMLAALVDSIPADLHGGQPGVMTYSRLLDLIQTAELHHVYILIDRTDESGYLVQQPERVSRVLLPLLMELPLMEMPNAAFKFFLQPEVVQALLSSRGIRPDRVPFREFHWTDSAMRELLSLRLSILSNAQTTSIGQMCEPALSVDVEDRLLSAANGVPRNLLRLAHQMVIEHCMRAGNRLLLSIEDWESAIHAFEYCNALAPG